MSDGAIIKCNHKSCVKVVNIFNIQSKTPYVVTLTRDNIYTLITRRNGTF
jgi:hypothetical protein